MFVSVKGCYICRPGPRWRELRSGQWGGESTAHSRVVRSKWVGRRLVGPRVVYPPRALSLLPPGPVQGARGGRGPEIKCHTYGAAAPGGGYTAVLCGLRRGRQRLAPPVDRAHPTGIVVAGFGEPSSAASRSNWAKRPSVRGLWLLCGWGRRWSLCGHGTCCPKSPALGSTRCGVSGPPRGLLSHSFCHRRPSLRPLTLLPTWGDQGRRRRSAGREACSR